MVPHAEPGDNLLMLAARCDALQAAGALIENGIDVMHRNRKGDSISLLMSESNTRVAKRILEAHDFVRIATGKRHLTDEQEEAVAHLPSMRATCDRARVLLEGLCNAYEERLLQIIEFERQDWANEVEGRAPDVKARIQIARKGVMITDLKVARAAHQEVAGALQPLESAELRIIEKILRSPKYAHLMEKEASDDAGSSSQLTGSSALLMGAAGGSRDGVTDMSSVSFDNINLEEWLVELDGAAALLQSVWRGNRVRDAIRAILREAAAIRVQGLWRTAVTRNRNAIQMIKVQRELQAQAERERRVKFEEGRLPNIKQPKTPPKKKKPAKKKGMMD